MNLPNERAPAYTGTLNQPVPTPTNTFKDSRESGQIFTRSSDLGDQLDANALEQITLMIEGGWSPPDAAAGWQDYVETLAQAAANGAVAELTWKAS